MKLPININDLVTARTVEWERLEFKAGWNPKAVLHTMCAFANDFHNLGGGYIVIGVAEDEGRPVLPPAGLPVSRIDAVQREIVEIGYRMIPYYHPIIAPYEISGKHILVLWAAGGQTRPYKAPVSLAKGEREFAYYIRKGSVTVRAGQEDEAELMSLAATVPFDDRLNQRAGVEDLSRELMLDFLQEVGSDLFSLAPEVPLVEIGRQMHIIGGPDEAPFPLNVGLLFFNPEPRRFFPAAQIDVVWFPDDAGGNKFTEKTFHGPLPRMIREALDYIQRNYLNETVIKRPGKAAATRVANYFPYEAVEEAVVNAVYHRSYEEREPVEVRITRYDMVVLSYPGPDRSVRLEQLRIGRAMSRRYRNRRIGEFLKELDLTEGRATGIPKILRAMEENGSPSPEFEFDDDHTYFSVRLPVHPEAGRTTEDYTAVPEMKSGVESGVESKTAILILNHLQKSELGKKEIAKKLGKTKPTRYLNDLVRKMVANGLIDFTIPGKPTSRLQKYRLTDKGRIKVGCRT